MNGQGQTNQTFLSNVVLEEHVLLFTQLTNVALPQGSTVSYWKVWRHSTTAHAWYNDFTLQ